MASLYELASVRSGRKPVNTITQSSPSGSTQEDTRGSAASGLHAGPLPVAATVTCKPSKSASGLVSTTAASGDATVSGPGLAPVSATAATVSGLGLAPVSATAATVSGLVAAATSSIAATASGMSAGFIPEPGAAASSAPRGPDKPTVQEQLPGDDLASQYNYLQRTGALDSLAALRKENREMDRVITDAATLFALPNLSRMLDFIIDRLLERFIPEFLAFVIEPPRGKRLNQYCYRNLKPTEESVSHDSYWRIRSYFDAGSHPLEYRITPGLAGAIPDMEPFRPEYIFPMGGIGGIYGIVVLGSKVIGTGYSQLELMYVERMTRFLAVGIQNSMHHYSSITDSKTGLYTHDFFVRRLEEEIARCERHNARSCALMLDVDHFKHFNDTYGHLAGDVVLESLAATVKSIMRAGDAVARFGGEEFCVLGVDCDEQGAMELAERIRLAISSMQVAWENRSLEVTVSIGARMIEAGLDSMTVLDDADKALYVSKTAGRNRSTLFRTGFLGRAMMIRKPFAVDRCPSATVA